MALVQVQQFKTGTSCGPGILHQCVKRVKSKSMKDFGASSYVSRSYRGKTDREPFHSPPILIRAKKDKKIILTIFCQSKF